MKNSIYTRNNLSHLLAIPLTLATSLAIAQESNDLIRFHQVEKTVINCLYPQHLALDMTPEQIKFSFSPPTRTQCQNAIKEFNRITTSKSRIATQYPNALQALAITREQQIRPRWSAQLIGEVPMLTTPGRSNAHELGFDSWTTEHKLRKLVGLGSKPKSCQLNTSQLNLHSQDDLFRTMLAKGMNCLIRDFKSQSLAANTARFEGSAQEFLKKSIQVESLKQDLTEDKFLKGYWVFHFPQLGYDLSDLPMQSEKENLDMKSLREHVQNLGAKFIGLERVTLQHLNTQVQVSLEQIRQAMNSPEFQRERPKVLFTSRSMGAMVMRDLLTRYPDIREKVDGALLIGSTPWGSAIADYRSRADVFDESFSQLTNPLSQSIFFVAGSLKPSYLKIRDAALEIKNIESMSHLTVTPRKMDWNFPMANVILLPDHIENFFGGSERIAGVDVTMLLTSYYGPTEGSSPLSGAGLDSNNSLRVFDNRFNHLAFWALNKRQALELWNASFRLILKQMNESPK